MSENKYPVAVVVELGVNGLGIIRSLGKRGIPVIGIDSESDYASSSKYCKTIYCKNVNDYSLVETLLTIGRSLKTKGVLFCASDLSLLIVSRYREELENYYSFVLPPHDVIDTLLNKMLFYQFAQKHQFSVPKTIETNNKKEVEESAHILSFPCVIKPQIRDSYWCEHVPEKVLYVKSPEKYSYLFSNYQIYDRPLIIQEWIEGNDEDVYFCLAYINRNLEPLATFTGRKIRQYPPLTGVTSVAQGIKEPFIEQESLRLLRLAGCVGICSVEYKFCKKEKLYKITEPTVGRTDLQEALSVKSGIDIPYIAYLDALGKNLKPTRIFIEGLKWINETLEIYHISNQLKLSKYNIINLLASYRGRQGYALLDIHDPIPFLAFMGQIIRRKLFRKTSF